MSQGRFLNQKLGKRISRKYDLLKAQLAGPRAPGKIQPPHERLPKKGVSREERKP